MKEQVAEWFAPIVIAVFAVVVRLMFNAERKSFWGVLRSLVIGIFVGSMANMYLADVSGLTDGARGAIVGMSVIISEDLIGILIKIAKTAKEDPVAFLNKFRGISTTSATKPGVKKVEDK